MIVIIVIVMMILKSTGNAINSCTTIKLLLFCYLISDYKCRITMF